MEREITRSKVVEETTTVDICDRCGREASDEIHWVPRDDIVDHVEAIETNIDDLMETVEGIGPIPNPDYTKKTSTSDGGGLVAGPTVTATITYYSTAPIRTSGGSKTVTYNYEGIDADEDELVRMAQSLKESRNELLRLMSSFKRSVEALARVPEATETFDLCEECHDLVYKWDAADGEP